MDHSTFLCIVNIIHYPDKIWNSNILFTKCFMINVLFFDHTTQHAGILVPQPGVEPVPSAMEVQSSNHWITRGFPHDQFYF